MHSLTCAWVGGAKPGGPTQGRDGRGDVTGAPPQSESRPGSDGGGGADRSLGDLRLRSVGGRLRGVGWGGPEGPLWGLVSFCPLGRPCPSLSWDSVRVGDDRDAPAPLYLFTEPGAPTRWGPPPAGTVTLGVACLARPRRRWWSRPLSALTC